MEHVMTGNATTAHRRGKAHERAMAGRLNGQRVGVTGLATQDVDCGRLSIECKSRKELPAWLLDAVQQARRNARAEQLAVVILHQVGRRHDGDLVVLRLCDWEQWYGAVALPESDEEVES